MTVTRMDNVGIVVEDLDAAIAFFTELGLTLEGRMPIEGEWAGRVTGVHGQRVEIAMLRTPDGHSRLELSRFDAPAIASDHRTAPVNSLGYLRVMFTVEDIDDTLTRLGKLGATVVDEVVNYENVYRLCYIRGHEGILLGLAQQLGQQGSPEDTVRRAVEGEDVASIAQRARLGSRRCAPIAGEWAQPPKASPTAHGRNVPAERALCTPRVG